MRRQWLHPLSPPFIRPPLSGGDASCRRRSWPCPAQIRRPPAWIWSHPTQIWCARRRIRRRVGRQVHVDLAVAAVSSRFQPVASSPTLFVGRSDGGRPSASSDSRFGPSVALSPVGLFGGGPSSPRCGSPATWVCWRWRRGGAVLRRPADTPTSLQHWPVVWCHLFASGVASRQGCWHCWNVGEPSPHR